MFQAFQVSVQGRYILRKGFDTAQQIVCLIGRAAYTKYQRLLHHKEATSNHQIFVIRKCETSWHSYVEECYCMKMPALTREECMSE